MDRELRRGCRCSAVIVLVLWFCCMSADCLHPSNDERGSLWDITNDLRLGDEGSSLSIIETDSSRKPKNDRSSLWVLPINGPACDLSTQECSGGSITTDESIGDNSAGLVARKDMTVEEKRPVVLCSIKCFRADPVCGEDAITYWCGPAEAKCAGVEVAYKGYCDARSGGAGKDGTRAAQSLFLVHLIWLVLAGFLVIADLL